MDMGTGTWTPSHHQIYQLFGYGAQTALLTALRSGDAAARKVFFKFFFLSCVLHQATAAKQARTPTREEGSKKGSDSVEASIRTQISTRASSSRDLQKSKKGFIADLLCGGTCLPLGRRCISPDMYTHGGSPKRLHPQHGDPWIDLADIQHSVFLLPRDLQPLGRRKTADYFGRCDIFPVQVGRAARRSQGCWLRESGAISLAVCCVLPAAFHSS